jgi:hypothetical protein
MQRKEITWDHTLSRELRMILLGARLDGLKQLLFSFHAGVYIAAIGTMGVANKMTVFSSLLQHTTDICRQSHALL